MTTMTALGDVTNMAANRLKSGKQQVTKNQGQVLKNQVGAKRKRSQEMKSQRSSTAHPCDRKHEDNELHCVEYLRSINKEMRATETKYMPNANYMGKQEELNYAMRGTLLDWLVEVHQKFKLRDETLFLTVLLIDRYLEKVQVGRRKLQCVGIVAMLVASKYEEIYPPEIVDFCQITDNAYDREEVLNMEIDMLNRLEFNLTQSTSLMFLRRYLAVDGAEPQDLRSKIAHFLLELTLPESFALKYTPSKMAAASVYLANRLFEVSNSHQMPSWGQSVEQYTRYDEKILRPCTKEILCVLCSLRDRNYTLRAVYRKYARTGGVIESAPIQKVLCG